VTKKVVSSRFLRLDTGPHFYCNTTYDPIEG
jgi:hypothetical protein